jgi:hypothetical protein
MEPPALVSSMLCQVWNKAGDYGAKLDSADPSTSGFEGSLYDAVQEAARRQRLRTVPNDPETIIELIDEGCRTDGNNNTVALALFRPIQELGAKQGQAYYKDLEAKAESQERAASYLCADWLALDAQNQRALAEGAVGELARLDPERFSGVTVDEVVLLFAAECTPEHQALSLLPILQDAIADGSLD